MSYYIQDRYLPKKKGPKYKTYLTVFLLLLGLLFWQGEKYYYKFFQHDSRLENYLNEFYAKNAQNVSIIDVIETLANGLKQTGKMIKYDPFNARLQYYRAEFQFQYVIKKLNITAQKVVKFAARPNSIILSEKLKKQIDNIRIAALKSIAIKPDTLFAQRCYYLAGFSYLFAKPILKSQALGYMSKNIHAFKNNSKFKGDWPLLLAAIYNKNGNLARKKLKDIKGFSIYLQQFFLAIIHYYEEQYNSGVILFENILLNNTNSDDEKIIKLIKGESAWYLSKIYFKQNLNTKATDYLRTAYKLVPDNIEIKQKIQIRGIKTGI